MFGKRKGPTSPSEPAGPQLADAGAQPGGEEALARPQTVTPTVKSTPLGANTAASAGSAPAGSASSGVTAGKAATRRPEGRLPSGVEGRKLVVGREICLAGEIKTCEKLVVEGKVEADLSDSHSLEISEPGLFKGNATVEDCEVSGTFEGELTVTGTLAITPTGRVSGKIRYAELEMARGARLSGDIDSLDGAARDGRPARGEGPKLAHANDPESKSRLG
ncbi:bactofilin family protein [Pelagibius marinus]|uniref:bactofilin family protein n=1 Tax=Pelagibius marinus TaxID=2762760 RepID=UPI001872650E|nr:polymer-forming cytoskeletal protein [Pelagibius marinus]